MNLNSKEINFPWHNPSRIAAWQERGKGEAVAKLLLKNRPLLSVELFEIEIEPVAKSLSTDISMDAIETFLQCDNLRIVADQQKGFDEITLEVELEDIDDLVTEELAEIYATQGLIDEAKVIYTRLSLQNSEKSVYFAELIKVLSTNQENN